MSWRWTLLSTVEASSIWFEKSIMVQLTYLKALALAQREEMARDDKVFILGQDVRADMFGTTTGFAEIFGPDRLIDAPICEAGMTGVGAGAAMVGLRPILDFTCASFLYPAMDQIINIVAKSRYLYGGQARLPLVMRAVMLYQGGKAAQHSDRPYSMFMNMPGLKIVVPSTAYDAKGLLKSAIRDDDPVMFFEDSSLWTTKSDIPDEECLVPIGKGIVRQEGHDVTIVAIGATRLVVEKASAVLEREGISVEIIDPRTLVPLDHELIVSSVAKTGRLVIADVSFDTCSAASQIAAVVAERAFHHLRGPIVRVTTAQTHIPFSQMLEPQLYPSPERVVNAVRETLRSVEEARSCR